MKDIHEVNQLCPLQGCSRKLHLMDRKLGGARLSCYSRRPKKLLHRPPEANNANNTAQPGQHQKTHKDVDTSTQPDLGPPPHLPGQRRGRGKKVKAHAERERAHSASSTGPASNAQLQKARPNLRLQSQHQLIN